jgi:hypothetical protein
MAVDLREVSRRLRLFKNIEPRTYDEIVALLDEYVLEQAVLAVNASSEDVLRAQGRAQIAMKFLRVFTELPPT